MGFLAFIRSFVRSPEREQSPETAEEGWVEEISKRVPESLSGKGATPLGSTDQHSDAPAPHGLGDRVGHPPGS